MLNTLLVQLLLLSAPLTLAMGWPVTVRQSAPSSAPVIEVYKTPTCGCCVKWVKHLRDAGFNVHTEDVQQDALDKIKAKHGVPSSAVSCHTARVQGYTVEGHVPASEITRLLKERPNVAGLAVPGMPPGSPGMEAPGVRLQPYNVLAFDKQGKTQVFSVQKP